MVHNQIASHRIAGIFAGSKAPWFTIPDNLPQHEACPPEFKAKGVERPVVAPRANFTDGSCLRGEIPFEIAGAPQRTVNCHCTRRQCDKSAARHSGRPALR